MVESSRKHGAADGRWPGLPKVAPRTWVAAGGDADADELDWSDFLERFFPNRRRHDRAALAAYEGYRHRLDGQGAKGPPATNVAPVSA
jgi:hypothetical protein